MEENAEETTFVVVKKHGEVIIVRSGRKFKDQFVKVKSHVRMELVYNQQAFVSAKKDGRENFVINVRIKEDVAPQNHNKIEVELC